MFPFLYKSFSSGLRNRINLRAMCNTVTKRGFPDTSLHEQLPRNVLPTNYDVKCYNIDQVKNVFKGRAIIDLDVLEKTKSITLNQKFLNFDKVVVKGRDASQEVSEITKNDENETVEFKLKNEIEPSEKCIQLVIDFNGLIRTDMAGFYTSNYKNDKGETKYILTTQFESTDARSAFPCYDEPNCKATFRISIEVSKELTVLSNMPLEKETETDSEKKLCIFAKTPKMSTYLVAWAIGQFEYVESSTAREYNGARLPIRVYTIPGQSENGRYALETAQNAVDYLSTVFDIDYPLPKLDLLAVPQFGANAMENWGLVTFRATALLFDPVKSSIEYKVKVSYVVSHEVAHSWFGNYCTMNWWSDLWLNESFATYIAWLCVDHKHPEWEVFNSFVSSSMQSALDLDSLKNSHPVEVQVYHANEIDEIFDAISYLKGGSVIRMVAESIGIELFLKGVSNYLKKYPFGNAKSDDLWDAISEVSNQNITELVEPWIRAIGFPSLHVSKEGDKIKIEQKRFLTEGITEEDDQITWWIPNVEGMNTKEVKIDDDDFLKLNKNTTGFYRVFYSEELFDNIVKNLDKLTAKDKIGLVADTGAGARAGLVATSQFLELISQLKNENDVAVWSQIIDRLGALRNSFFSDEEISSKLLNFSKDLYKSKFEELINTKNLDFNQQRLASLIFEQAGICGLDSAVQKASQLFKANDIKPHFKQAIYRTLLANESTTTEEVFNTIIKDVKEPNTIDSREVALRALGSIKNSKSFLSNILELFFDGTVPEMDYQFLATPLAANFSTKVEFWSYFKMNYPKFRGDVSMWTLDRVIKNFLPKIVSDELATDIGKFFSDKDNAGYEKGLKQSLDSIHNDCAWSRRATEDVSRWFIKHGY